MEVMLSTDEDINRFFNNVVAKLVNEADYSKSDALSFVRDYYEKFTDTDYCESIGIPVQDDDFFFHEGVGGMALRIHYYLNLGMNPDPKEFIEWRANLRK